MTHHFTGEAGASLVFAVLYSALFAWMLSSYLTGRYKWKSRWSLLFFHVTIRVASQVCRPVGFGTHQLQGLRGLLITRALLQPRLQLYSGKAIISQQG